MGKNKRGNRRRNKKKAPPVSVHRGPSMNGMQQVTNWTLFDVTPVTYTSIDAQLDVPTLFQLVTGPNGWSWELRQGGNIVGN